MPLDDDAKRKMVLEALLSETARLGDAIAERHAAAERFVAVAGTLVGIGLTLGLLQNQKAVLTGLPVAIIVILVYMIQIYTDAGMHSGHRQALEARLEREFGYPVVVGQSRVAAGYARRRSVKWTLALVGIIWLATAVSGGFAVFQMWTLTWVRIIALITYLSLLGWALMVVRQAVIENQKAEGDAKEIATAAWSEPWEPSEPSEPSEDEHGPRSAVH